MTGAPPAAPGLCSSSHRPSLAPCSLLRLRQTLLQPSLPAGEIKMFDSRLVLKMSCPPRLGVCGARQSLSSRGLTASGLRVLGSHPASCPSSVGMSLSLLNLVLCFQKMRKLGQAFTRLPEKAKGTLRGGGAGRLGCGS